MPRYLGIDFGHKRIGLAVSDPDGLLAMPVGQCSCTGSIHHDAVAIQEIVQEYQIDEIVVGLPLKLDGGEGPQAGAVRKFGDALGKELHRPIQYWDERLSSAAADHLLDQRGKLTRKQRRARRDALAAQTILQTFLDHRRPGAILGEWVCTDDQADA